MSSHDHRGREPVLETQDGEFSAEIQEGQKCRAIPTLPDLHLSATFAG